MYAVDSFDSTPPLATFAPRLAYGLGVVVFPVFLFLVIGSLFEHRSTAGSCNTYQATYRWGGEDSAIP